MERRQFLGAFGRKLEPADVWGDSEMPRYGAFCTVVRQCSTAKQLERAVPDIVAAYQ